MTKETEREAEKFYYYEGRREKKETKPKKTR
jgi:hypothetical protein